MRSAWVCTPSFFKIELSWVRRVVTWTPKSVAISRSLFPLMSAAANLERGVVIDVFRLQFSARTDEARPLHTLGFLARDNIGGADRAHKTRDGVESNGPFVGLERSVVDRFDYVLGGA